MNTKTSAVIFCCYALLALGSIFCLAAAAQTAPLPLGTVSTPTQLSHCPAGFYTGPSNQTVCYGTVISGCLADPIGLTFSFLNPAVSPNLPNGTIVLFASGGGQMTVNENNSITAKDYYNANYAVVQTSWGNDWEDTNQGISQLLQPPAYSILNAACRPATFINYIATNSQFSFAGEGMCAQGSSAGSGAVAYSIVWYGMGSKLNNVELNVGPVFERGPHLPILRRVYTVQIVRNIRDGTG